MTADESPPEGYERGIRKLIELVSRIHHNTEWNPTEQKKALEDAANKLEELAELLLSGPAAYDLETAHDERGIPERVIGLDGFLIEQPESEWPSYQSIKWDIRELAMSARIAAERLPNPRKRHALEFAARGLLYLRHDYGFPRVTLSNDSADVSELERVCTSAGLVLSPERYRGALAESLKTFDPHFVEPGYESILK